MPSSSARVRIAERSSTSRCSSRPTVNFFAASLRSGRGFTSPGSSARSKNCRMDLLARGIGVDQLVAPVPDALMPSIVLTDQGVAGRFRPAGREGKDAAAREARRERHARGVEDRRHDVEGRDEDIGPDGLRPPAEDDEGNALDGIEEIRAVIEVVVVLAQALAVVGGDDDGGATQDPRGLEGAQDLVQLRVRVRDLTVVGVHVVGQFRLSRDRPLLRDAAEETVHHLQGWIRPRGDLETRCRKERAGCKAREDSRSAARGSSRRPFPGHGHTRSRAW